MTGIVNPDALKSSRLASCRRRQLRDFLRYCDRKGYKPMERAVFTALWVHLPQGKNGAPDPSATCWPTINTLARLSGASERNVQRALSLFAAAGDVWITRPARHRRTPSGRSYIGTMNVDRGVQVYLLTYFAAGDELREWADLAKGGENIVGTGTEAHASPTPAEGANGPDKARAK